MKVHAVGGIIRLYRRTVLQQCISASVRVTGIDSSKQDCALSPVALFPPNLLEARLIIKWHTAYQYLAGTSWFRVDIQRKSGPLREPAKPR
jgi:hypothetical protein